MRKITKYRFDYQGYDTSKLKLIGRGHEGKVYLLPNDKVLKVFHNPNSCARQVEILLIAQNSRFFPTVFGYDKYSIIMSFVHGSPLSIYLKQNHISKHLSHELVHLINEFKRLHFTKLDMRLGHIFLQPNETIKVIDPRGSYDKKRPYPKSMLRGLQKHGELGNFFDYIKYDYPDYYHYWRKMLSK
jgi:RIO-like serine/threonine protein kinase